MSPAPAGPAATAVDADTTPVLVRMPGADGSADLPTIQKALDDCDVEAARSPDGLYFVILPLLSPVKNYQPWIAVSVGEIGHLGDPVALQGRPRRPARAAR